MFGLFKKESNIDITKMSIYKEGSLTKEGEKVLSWKRRDFLLTSNTLEYLKPGERKKALGSIPLENSKVEKSNKSERKYVFQLVTPKRIYYLSADSELEMNEWIKAIHDRIKTITPEKESISQSPRIEEKVIEKVEEKIETPIMKPIIKKNPGISIEDEYDILLCSFSIFMKSEDKRSPEEKAYIIAMKKYTEKLIEYMKKTNSKCEFSLAGGTYILCKENKTKEELDFIEQMKEIFLKEQNLSFQISIQDQIKMISLSKEIFDKINLNDQEKEYKKKLKEQKRKLTRLERKHGLKSLHNLVSGSIILSKYHQEKDENDLVFLNEISQKDLYFT